MVYNTLESWKYPSPVSVFIWGEEMSLECSSYWFSSIPFSLIGFCPHCGGVVSCKFVWTIRTTLISFVLQLLCYSVCFQMSCGSYKHLNFHGFALNIQLPLVITLFEMYTLRCLRCFIFSLFFFLPKNFFFLSLPIESHEWAHILDFIWSEYKTADILSCRFTILGSLYYMIYIGDNLLFVFISYYHC